MFGFGQKSDTNEIEVSELAKYIKNNEADTIVVDVRSEEEFAEESVEGMKNYPLSEFFQHVNEVGQHKKIYIFCRSGARSAQAVEMLHNAGISQATNVRGGLIAWKDEGLPIV